MHEEDGYELLSFEKIDLDNGFFEDLDGDYIRRIDLEELESAYIIDIWCRYKGYDFQVDIYSDVSDEVVIWAMESEPAMHLGFERHAPGEYRKFLIKGELDKVYEIKRPIPGFELPEED